ncbi:MAG: hypothetical protein WC627_10270 [Legionella sp.]|jgi:hypothetical protein
MRRLDCELTANAHSLIKNSTLFSETTTVYHGGTQGAQGRFFKTSKDANKTPKAYYLAKRRGFNEYFASEILSALGFNTPKIRFVQTTDGTIVTAGKEIKDYVPLQAFYPNSNYLLRRTPEIEKVQKKYRFNKERQVIASTDAQYKISGKLYAANIACYLIQDTDLSGDLINLGLVNENGRFRTYFIDKEFASLRKRKDYDDLVRLEFHDLERVFTHQTLEQKLSVIYSIKKLVESAPGTDKSRLHRIFFNARTASIYQNYLQQMIKSKFAFVLDKCFKHLKLLSSDEKIQAVFENFKKELSVNFASQFTNLDFKPENPLDDPIAIKKYINEITQKPELIIRAFMESTNEYDSLIEFIFWKSRKHGDEHPSKTGQSLADFIIKKFMYRYNKILDGYSQGIRFNDPDNFIYVQYPIEPIVMYENIIANAQILIENAGMNDKQFYKDFETREQLRRDIAQKLINKFRDKQEQQELGCKIQLEDIIEDLTGPYYIHLFSNHQNISSEDLNNTALLEKLCADHGYSPNNNAINSCL